MYEEIKCVNYYNLLIDKINDLNLFIFVIIMENVFFYF